ncbi:MAG: hypothetical protein IJQ66_00315 [Clostridia bacterium]|nr:hypothetical protein [Clostridia bacterium]
MKISIPRAVFDNSELEKRVKYAALKQKMLDKNLTSNDLAELLGIKSVTAKKYLNDYTHDFSVYQAFIIRDFYFDEYSVDELFGW